MFSELCCDVITIIKRNGERINNIKSSVQGKKCFIMGTVVDVQENDSIERTLPSGRVEKYVVVESSFFDGSLVGAGGHYELVLKKIV